MPSETVDQRLAQTLDAAAGGQASALGLYGSRGAGKTWWVDRAAEQQPVCVILDDLQWFDAATLEVRVGLPAAALQFALRHRAVTSVVVGARSREEVEADIADARVAIPEALWDELDEL